MRARRLVAAVLPIVPVLAAGQTPPPTHKAVEQVIVRARAAIGGGLIAAQDAFVARSTVGAPAIARQAPTSNAFELLRLVPGANTSTSDPYGLSPSVNISVRGLNGDEIAYVVEGAPVGDIGYYAGYPSQWVDAENIKSVSLQQGTPDLDTPTINAGGGLISLDLRDPAEAAGGYAAGTYGSYHAHRAFVRLDSGPIAGTAAHGFVSASDTAADNYRGAGRDHRQHVDFKLIDEWSDGNRIAIAGSYHNAILSGYPMPTLAAWSAYGRSTNYDAVFSPGDANYWKLFQQTWHDEQVSIPSHLTLTDHLSFEATPYFQHGFGNTPYGTTLPTIGLYLGTQAITQPVHIQGAAGGRALVLADYIGNQYRAGINGRLIARFGAHRVVAGWWFDYADDYDPQPFTPVSSTGEPATIQGFPYTIKLQDGRTLAAQEAHTRAQANVLFVGDTLDLLAGRLRIDAGVRYAMVSRTGTNSLPGPQYRVGLNSAQPLPRAAVRYSITSQTQLFASVSTNFRSGTEYALYNTYDVFGDQLSRGSSQRDEYSISEEAGVRVQAPALDVSLSVFNYNFTNRQISTLISGVIGTSINAGGQTSRGIDAEVGFLVAPHFRPYISAEYLHATTDNNLVLSGRSYATAGKTAVRSPAFQCAVGLGYDNVGYFANLAVKYTGSQYATFINDEKIPSHVQADATLGMHLPDWRFIKSPEVGLNLINVTDAKFLSGVASVQPDVRAGAPTYYVGTGFAAVITVGTGF